MGLGRGWRSCLSCIGSWIRCRSCLRGQCSFNKVGGEREVVVITIAVARILIIMMMMLPSCRYQKNNRWRSGRRSTRGKPSKKPNTSERTLVRGKVQKYGEGWDNVEGEVVDVIRNNDDGPRSRGSRGDARSGSRSICDPPKSQIRNIDMDDMNSTVSDEVSEMTNPTFMSKKMDPPEESRISSTRSTKSSVISSDADTPNCQ